MLIYFPISQDLKFPSDSLMFNSVRGYKIIGKVGKPCRLLPLGNYLSEI